MEAPGAAEALGAAAPDPEVVGTVEAPGAAVGADVAEGSGVNSALGAAVASGGGIAEFPVSAAPLTAEFVSVAPLVVVTAVLVVSGSG